MYFSLPLSVIGYKNHEKESTDIKYYIPFQNALNKGKLVLELLGEEKQTFRTETNALQPTG